MRKYILFILLIIISFSMYSQKRNSVDGRKSVLVNSNRDYHKKHKSKKTYKSSEWYADNGPKRSGRGDCSDFGFTGAFYPKRMFVTLNGSYSIKPVASLGATFGMVKHFGWFVNVMVGTNFRTFRVDGEFDSGDASTAPPFLKGDSYRRSTRLSAMAGGLLRVASQFAFRLGVGYGVNDMCYEGMDGRWFRDKKTSVRGIDASVGMHYEISKLLISIDVVTTEFKELECKIGVGFIF